MVCVVFHVVHVGGPYSCMARCGASRWEGGRGEDVFCGFICGDVGSNDHKGCVPVTVQGVNDGVESNGKEVVVVLGVVLLFFCR